METKKDEMICYCAGVTRGDIEDAIKLGARTLSDVRRMTGACTQGNCQEKNPKKTCCAPDIKEILLEYAAREKAAKMQR